MGSSIDPDSSIGAVHLTVADVAATSDFYQRAVGLTELRREGDTAFLGAGPRELVVLHQLPGARYFAGHTGLFHLALLLPSRADLGLALKRLITSRTLMQGMSEHAVSEALYLADVDFAGIEIYRDRPKSEWPVRDGELVMVTEPIDVQGVLGACEGSAETLTVPDTTVMGHVHLHVADLAAAEHFYCDVLGFDLKMRYGDSALFVSAGGYHHHVGLNTWAGVGAPPPPAGSAGLRYFEIVMPGSGAAEAAVQRVQQHGGSAMSANNGWLIQDPSNNGIMLRAN